MAQYSRKLVDTESITVLGWIAVALVLVTGVLHVYAGVVEGRIPVLLAGVGFLGAIALYLADYRRRSLFLAGIFYTAVQIPIWYVVNAGEYTTVGYVDKVVQVVLVALLAYLFWSTRDQREERREAAETEQVG